MSKELATTFSEQINNLHRQGQAFDEELARVILDKVNVTRECGSLINTAKDDLPNKEWEQLKKELSFDADALQAYLTFARRHPEPFSELKEALRAIEGALQSTGLLPFPDGHGPQKLHSVNLFSWVAKAVTTFISELKKRITVNPIASWHPDVAAQFVVQVQPMANWINNILSEAKARAMASRE